MSKEWGKYNNKLEIEKKKFRRICKYCGWTNLILNKYNRIPCKNCGNMIYLTNKDEMKYKIMRYINEKSNS